MATSRTLYEATLIELNKENAPNITLEDFNYFANKAVNLYINKRYNIYDINQQTTDDLRVLKATTILKPEQVNSVYDILTNAGENKNATYECILPSDYLHMLNCICVYNVTKTYKCYNAGNKFRAAATRLTADAYSTVLDNYWNRPTYKRPYYYIHNVNLYDKETGVTPSVIPTNPYISGKGTDAVPNSPISGVKVGILYKAQGIASSENELPIAIPPDTGTIFMNSNPSHNCIGWIRNANWDPILLGSLLETNGNVYYQYNDNYKLLDSTNWTWNNVVEFNYSLINTLNLYYNVVEGFDETQSDAWGNPILNTRQIDIFSQTSDGSSNVERASHVRYGNASQVRLEIRYGTDNSIFSLERVYIDYIKTPQNIRLTQEQLDKTEDTSQVLEFPDYVCQEIINELVTIIMENISDPKLLTHPVVSLSIANPAQQLTQPQQ